MFTWGPRQQAQESTVVWSLADSVGTWSLSVSDRQASVTSGTGVRNIVSNVGRSSGKRYFELTRVSGDEYSDVVRDDDGITRDKPPGSGSSPAVAGAAYRRGGLIVAEGGVSTATSTLTAGDVIGVAVDLDNGKVWFAKNNTWASGDPSTDTSPSVSGLTAGTYYIGTSQESPGTKVVLLRAATSQFTYSAPTGFVSWAD